MNSSVTLTRTHFVYLILAAFVAATFILIDTPFIILAPAIPIALIGGILMFRYPGWGVVLVAFFVPLEGLFADSKYFTASKLLGAALIGIAFLQLMTKNRSIDTIHSRLWLPIGALFLVFLVSSMFSVYPALGPNVIRQLAVAIAIFALAIIFRKEIPFERLFEALVLSTAVTAVVALAGNTTSEDNRAIGLMTDPNYFAMLLTTATPMAIFLIIKSRFLLFKLFWLGMLALLMLAFVKTFSRSGLLVLGITLIAMAYHYKHLINRIKPEHLGFILLAGLIGVGALVKVLPEEYVDRIKSITALKSGTKNASDRSLGRRSSYVIVGVNSLKENPLIGTGPGTFPYNYARSGYSIAFNLSEKNPDIYRRAHNTYLEVAAETGILGLLCFLSITYLGGKYFLAARANFARQKNWYLMDLTTHLTLSYVAVILFLLFLSATNHKYYWLLLACGYILYQYSRLNQHQPTEARSA